MTNSKAYLFHPGDTDKLPSFGVLDQYVRHRELASDQSAPRVSVSAQTPQRVGDSFNACRTHRSDANPKSPANTGGVRPGHFTTGSRSKNLMRSAEGSSSQRDLKQVRHLGEPVNAGIRSNASGVGFPMPRSQHRHSQAPSQKNERSSTSRTCNNCGVSQTRQWVRGDAQAWLCHSCGQFWRKNGYSRPEELWNRPTFRRSSRKRRVNLELQDHEKKPKPGRGTRDASSSYINGKKMVECGEKLSPMLKTKSPQGEPRTRTLEEEKAHSKPWVRPASGAQSTKMIHGEPPLPPISHLLRKNGAQRRSGH